jgi:hypothetical protein
MSVINPFTESEAQIHDFNKYELVIPANLAGTIDREWLGKAAKHFNAEFHCHAANHGMIEYWRVPAQSVYDFGMELRRLGVDKMSTHRDGHFINTGFEFVYCPHIPLIITDMKPKRTVEEIKQQMGYNQFIRTLMDQGHSYKEAITEYQTK